MKMLSGVLAGLLLGFPLYFLVGMLFLPWANPNHAVAYVWMPFLVSVGIGVVVAS